MMKRRVPLLDEATTNLLGEVDGAQKRGQYRPCFTELFIFIFRVLNYAFEGSNVSFLLSFDNVDIGCVLCDEVEMSQGRMSMLMPENKGCSLLKYQIGLLAIVALMVIFVVNRRRQALRPGGGMHSQRRRPVTQLRCTPHNRVGHINRTAPSSSNQWHLNATFIDNHPSVNERPKQFQMLQANMKLWYCRVIFLSNTRSHWRSSSIVAVQSDFRIDQARLNRRRETIPSVRRCVFERPSDVVLKSKDR